MGTHICNRFYLDPLRALKEEHSSLLEQVYALDAQLSWLESSGPTKTRKILHRLLTGGEKLAEELSFHFQREEDALYPILEKRMSDKAEPVRIMRQEHVNLSTRLTAFNSEIERMLKEHDNLRTWEVSSSLQRLRSELSDHVSREENVLFWLAEIHLSKIDQNKVYSRLAQMRPEFENITPTLSPRKST